jgi:hypothetical protein
MRQDAVRLGFRKIDYLKSEKESDAILINETRQMCGIFIESMTRLVQGYNWYRLINYDDDIVFKLIDHCYAFE